MAFVSKVMSLLFNRLSRFLPRSGCLLISWLQLASAVILKPKIKEIKSITISIFPPIYLPWSNATWCLIGFWSQITRVSMWVEVFFNMLSRLVITLPPRSKSLLISWLQSPSAMILEPNKIKSLTVSIVYPSISHEMMGPNAMILAFWMLTF